MCAPGCLRMAATAPSVIDSPMLGTSTVTSFHAALLVLMLRDAKLAEQPSLLGRLPGCCERGPTAGEQRSAEVRGGGRR